MDPITIHRPNAKLAHFSGGISDDAVPVIKHDAKAAIGEDFINLTLNGK
ncbi:MAG: hypothetical protein RLZZ136_299 [Pseudomonadota bacterium]